MGFGKTFACVQKAQAYLRGKMAGGGKCGIVPVQARRPKPQDGQLAEPLLVPAPGYPEMLWANHTLVTSNRL